MKCLIWRWMFAAAVVGLMVGTPLLAGDKDGPTARDVFEALAIAEVNVNAASEATLNGQPLPPAIAVALAGVANDIGQSRSALGSLYPTQLRDASRGHKPSAESKLADQASKASEELSNATKIVGSFSEIDHRREDLAKAKVVLDRAISQLVEVQEAIKKADQGGVQNHTIDQDPNKPAQKNQGKDAADKLAKDQEAAQRSQTRRLYVVSGLAALLALIAIALVFFPVGPVATLRSSKKDLETELANLKSRQSELWRDFKGLGGQQDELNRKLKKYADAAKERENNQVTQDDWTSQERRTYERRKATGIGSEARVGARESSQSLPKLGTLARADGADEEDGVRVAPVKAAPKPRVPLADYEEARTKKPAERATEFSQMYARQTLLTCSNPSARNSGPFTDLRFREDQLGKFLAVEHGKEILLFPELNYEYSTGRKTLEGVFLYPDVESTTFRLTQPATLEKRGDEWALTRQGVFQNG